VIRVFAGVVFNVARGLGRSRTRRESATTQGSEESQMDQLQRNWGWLLALGIGLIVLGLLDIALPAIATLAIGIFVGWLLLIGGVAQIVHAFSARGWKGFVLHLLGGVLYLLVGGWMILNPLLGVLALTLLLAAFLLVQGIFQIALALRIRPARAWGWPLASGVVTALLAILIYAGWPSSALWVIGLLVGIHLLISGVSLTMLALGARAIAHELPAR
jgi:uncharacterized membrane protein HdeD (DUF308 family)